MLSNITTKLSVVPLAPTATVMVAHGIHIQGVSHAPNIVLPDQLTPIHASTVTATYIIFTNDGDATASADFYVALDHSVQKADGDLTSTCIWQGGSAVDSGIISPADLITLAVGITDPIRFNERVYTDFVGLPTVTPDANWGTTPSAALAAGSNDQRMRVTITADTDPVAANGTVVVVFSETYGTVPVVVVCSGGTDDIPTHINTQWSVTTVAATGFTLTFNGNPTASATYTFDAIVLG